MKNSGSIVIGPAVRDQRVPVANTGLPPKSAIALSTKRHLDVVLAGAFFVLFFPLFAASAILLLVVQGKPVVIRHKRIGLNGKCFPCLKFRTMKTNADEVLRAYLLVNGNALKEWEETRKLKDDPRVTSIGRVMRKLSIDELPQVINVIRGDMSLVGPRPIVRREVRFYGPYIHAYRSVRPGLTGPWQVSGRSDVSYAKRVELNVDYVINWSLWRDFAILGKTVLVVLKARGSC